MQQYKKDPTVILLYSVAKYALDHGIKTRTATTVDVLVDVASQTQKQFKRIIEATNDDKPDLKKIRTLSTDGGLYTQTCLYNDQQDTNETSTMSRPLDIPTQCSTFK